MARPVVRHLASLACAAMVAVLPQHPSARTATKSRQSKAEARRARQGDHRPRRRHRGGEPRAERAGGTLGMRLARRTGGRPDVARRPRHRVPPSRSLRPVRLSGRARPDFRSAVSSARETSIRRRSKPSMPGSIPAGSIRRCHRRRPPLQRQKKRISPEPNRRRPVYFAREFFRSKKFAAVNLPRPSCT